jgi:hypothetical protein
MVNANISQEVMLIANTAYSVEDIDIAIQCTNKKINCVKASGKQNDSLPSN